MPIVLFTADGAARSGYTYDDRTGVSYEYPVKIYDKLIQAGERFVYHNGGVGYSGVGIIGEITESPNPGKRVCEILDYRAFNQFVPLKDSAGDYYEADPTYWKTGKIFWSRGVRPISAARYEAIERVAGSAIPDSSTPDPGEGGRRKESRRKALPGNRYASPDVSIAVDLIAMETAIKEVRTWHPDLIVQEMPKNNPGFDIRVGNESAEHLFVEVKGTQSSEPTFFMSEGERKFSGKEASRYSLLVVTGIDIKSKTHGRIWRQDGEVAIEGVLEPSQWRGRLQGH